MPGRRLTKEARQLSKQEIIALKTKVAKRDKYRCVLCGKMGSGIDTHELLFKSADTPRSADIYQERYMAALCPEEHHALHDEGQAKKMLVQILIVLRSRHHYKYPRRLEKLLDLMQDSFRAELAEKLAQKNREEWYR